MTCKTRDQDLLLLAHGELPLLRRILTQAHLRRCASCRERYRQLENVSHVLAGITRGSSAPPWSPVRNNDSTGFAPGRLLLPALLTFVTVIVLYVIFRAAILPRLNAARPPSIPSQGCAPGLPNDQCR